MKGKLIQALLQLTLAQKQALEEDKIEEFEKLLQQREELISQLKALNEKESLEWSAEEQQIIKVLQQTDEANSKLFFKEMAEAKNEIGKIRNQRKVTHLYNHPYSAAREEGIFFDKRGR